MRVVFIEYVFCNLVGFWVQLVQAAGLRADPQITIPVKLQRIDEIIPDAVGNVCLMFVMGKFFSVFIEPVYAAAVGSYPKVTFIVLGNAFDKIMAEAVGVGRIVFIYSKPVSVIRINSILCSEPHKAPTVL